MLVNNIGSIANRLKYDFQNVSSKLQHPGVMGSLREEVLRNCLRELIPARYSIGTGIAVDAHETQSKQQDIFVYDGFMAPQFLKSEVTLVLPVESIYATIEVKSSLRKRDLVKAIENAASVRYLEKNILYPAGTHLEPTNEIISSVFAYSSELAIDTVHRIFDEINKSIPVNKRISIICILDKGCIVHAERKNLNNLILWPNINSITINKKNTLEQNLYLFYLIMQHHLSIDTNYPPDLIKYANISKTLNSRKIGLHIDSLSASEEVWIGNIKLSGDDVTRYRNMLPFIDRELTDDIVNQSGLTREALEGNIAWATNWIKTINIKMKMQNNKEMRGSRNP